MRLAISIFLAATLLLAGCASIDSETKAGNAYPANYREIVRDYVLSHFRDPYSIRDPFIAPPKLAMGPMLLPTAGMVTPWFVCVRANAKNAFGAYAGATPTVLAVYAGRVDNAFEGPAWASECSDAKYEPFPEIAPKSSS
jgi:hypothetical protein